MRIIHLIHDFNIEGTGGGVGRFGIGLAKRLSALGAEVTLAAIWQTHTGREETRHADLAQASVTPLVLGEFDPQRPTGSFWDAAKKLSAFVQAQQTEILHSHAEFGDVALLRTLLEKGAKPRLYRTVHYGYHYEWRRRPERRLAFTHFLLPLLMRREIGVSPAITETLNRRPLARLLKKRSLFIPNALDLERFRSIPKDARETSRAALGIPATALVFGSVGRLNVQKGYPYFIQAAAIAAKHLPEAVFVIAGEGEEAGFLAGEIERLGLAGRFRLLGPVTQVEGLLPAFDVFVSSSLWEGLPTVIMEAFAAQIPVVATRIPGTTTLVEDGRSGWLCGPGSAEELAATMLRAIQERAATPAFVAAGLRTVQEYAIDRVAERYLALYQSDSG